MKFVGGLLLLLALSVALSVGQAPSNPKITDLFTTDEFRKAGLSKLSTEEITALNRAIFRVFIQMNSQSESAHVTNAKPRAETQGLDYYDSRGKAVAYIDEDGDEDITFYLWDGKPVAYLDEDSVYGFNGKHLGWTKGSVIYDHDGNVVAALAEAFKGSVSIPPVKGLKQFKPFKAFKEFKPFKPFFSSNWSEAPARLFFLRGAA